MLLCIAAFTLFALPVGHGVGTEILVRVFHAPQRLAAIRTVDEAIVIAAALSLSSSAFVLQLLAERGELASKFGSATLGILLLQVCWMGVAGAAVGGSCCSALWLAAWLPRRTPATCPSVPLPDRDLRLQRDITMPPCSSSSLSQYVPFLAACHNTCFLADPMAKICSEPLSLSPIAPS